MQQMTGRHVLAILIIGFGIVFAVNGLFAYFAIGTFPGIEEGHPYRRGVDFNDQIARAQALDKLGWAMTVDLNKKRLLTLHFTDRDGRPLAMQSVSAMLFHPATQKNDRTLNLQPAGRGIFAISLASMPNGERELRVTATGPGSQPLEFRRKLWIE